MLIDRGYKAQKPLITSELPEALLKWALRDSNPEPTDYESVALTIELRAPCIQSPFKKRTKFRVLCKIYQVKIGFFWSIQRVNLIKSSTSSFSARLDRSIGQLSLSSGSNSPRELRKVFLL